MKFSATISLIFACAVALSGVHPVAGHRQITYCPLPCPSDTVAVDTTAVKNSTHISQAAQDSTAMATDSTAATTDSTAEAIDSVDIYTRIREEALKHLGKPYVWAANGPNAFDCSGFTRYVFDKAGIDLPRTSAGQFATGREVAGVQQLQEGDLVFFGRKNSIRNIGHVGIVISVDHMKASFSFIHASYAYGVIIQDCNSSSYFYMRFMGARRLLPDKPRQDVEELF